MRPIADCRKGLSERNAEIPGEFATLQGRSVETIQAALTRRARTYHRQLPRVDRALPPLAGGRRPPQDERTRLVGVLWPCNTQDYALVCLHRW